MAVDCSPAALLRALGCLSCLTPKQQQEIQTYLLCQIAGKASGYASPLIVPTMGVTGGLLDHGLGATPRYAGATLVVVANDANVGYQVGDEIPLINQVDTGTLSPVVQIWVTPTQIGWASNAFFPGGEGSWLFLFRNMTGASGGPADMSNFRLRLWAHL